MRMIVAFDYWNTLTQNPKFFSELASAIISEGGKVYIISACGPNRAKHNNADIEALDIPNNGIHTVTWTNHKDAPRLKVEKCLELGVQMIVDDRLDTCEEAFKHGIIAMNILKSVREKPLTTVV